ncbi:hypothetical protein KY289_009367 [Solanum tuberosum]|nr:hypothetical protein KY289_008177 [Solanum tuberosum]KAH0713408.1 hypothetical protein KY289_009367 [Solanum tuberosum]
MERREWQWGSRLRGNLKCMERKRGVGENNGGEGQRNGEDPNLQVSLINNVHLSLFHQFSQEGKENTQIKIYCWINAVCFKQFCRSNSDCRIINGRSPHLGSTIRSSSNDLNFFVEHHIRASQWYVRLQA